MTEQLAPKGTWYFLRHAQTAANVGRLYNPDGDELTASGKEDIARAAAYIKSLQVDAVFCSPLSRTQETARLLGLRFLCEPALTDRNFGEFAGKPYGSIKVYCAEHGIDPGTYAPQGGESYGDVQGRVLHFLRALPPGDYLFVSHAGVIAQVIHALTGKEFGEFSVENLALWKFVDGKLVAADWKPWEV